MDNACGVHTKLPDVGTTIFTVIRQLSAQYDALDLSIGAPNFPCDPRLVEWAAQAMRDGHNQYAPMTGFKSVRDALAEKVKRLYGASYDPDSEVTVMVSASEALYAATSALVHPGDEVIYFEPAFDSYAPVARLQGATPVAIKLKPDLFRIDWDQVAAAITPKTRMIILNSPHNPTATIIDEHDIARLTALTRDTDIVILSDEVYEHMVFDGAVHHSMARYPALAARSVVVFSFGKTYHLTGWRVGYCLAPAVLTNEIRKVHQFLTFAADTPMQLAFGEALADPQSYLSLANFYQKKRDLLASKLAGSRLRLLPSRGSFFMLASFRHLTTESDDAFVRRLISEHRVATIPLSAFNSDGEDTGLIRMSFAKDDDTLIEGARRLCAV
jgi:methionine aminotransferase